MKKWPCYIPFYGLIHYERLRKYYGFDKLPAADIIGMVQGCSVGGLLITLQHLFL